MANDSSFVSASKKKIVSIGGGNGPYLVGDGLRDKHVDVTILSTPADSGGDSGDIRDEMGEFLPPGDMRRGMMALMDSKYSAQLRRWFEHRMDVADPTKDKKKNVGNFVISSAIDEFGIIEGLKFVEWLCHVKGTVLPMSTDDVHLHGKLDDGTILRSESEIDLRSLDDCRVLKDVWLEPNAHISSAAAQAMLEADLITLGPGDLFTSIAGNQKVKGVNEVLHESKAVIVAIPSLMTKWSETRDYQVHDFVGKMVEFGIGRSRFDVTLVNNKKVTVPTELLQRYEEEEKSTPMLVRGKADMTSLKSYTKVIHHVDLLSRPALRKGLIRHDARKVAHALMDILYMGNGDYAFLGEKK
jgi:uncharacterized cofD-like protein